MEKNGFHALIQIILLREGNYVVFYKLSQNSRILERQSGKVAPENILGTIFAYEKHFLFHANDQVK